MTIDFIISDDLFANNDSINLNVLQLNVLPPPLLSAITISSMCSSINEHKLQLRLCLEAAIKFIDNTISIYNKFVLIVDNAWSPETRLTRYYSMAKKHPEWSSMKGIDQWQHVLLEKENQIRHAAIASILPDACKGIVDIYEHNYIVVLLAADKTVDFEKNSPLEIAHAALNFKDEKSAHFNVAWENMASWAYAKGILLGRMFGAFDDREVGVSIIGQSKIINGLAGRGDGGEV